VIRSIEKIIGDFSAPNLPIQASKTETQWKMNVDVDLDKFEDESGSMSPMVAEASRMSTPLCGWQNGLRIAGHSV